MAAKGRFVFPIKRNQKKPPLIKDWENKASDNPEQIETWEEQFPGCNWGLACGPSGLAVIDLDPRHGSDKSVQDLEDQFYIFPPTRSQRTPSGGRHLLYRGTIKSTANILGPGIDTKSAGGYVLLSGSKTADGEYEWENELPLADLPAWVAEKIGEPKEKPPTPPPTCDLDDPQAISRAVSFLLKEASIDETGYQVACQVRDLGISEDMCFLLMWEHYADRCEEPWDPDILKQKVTNAYHYAQGQCGALAPQEILSLLPDCAPAPVVKIPVRRMSDLDFNNIPRRQWLLGRRYLKGFITLTIAPGGQGKSTLTMAEAAAIASGKSITGDTVYHQGKVWIYNTEDPQEELDRRIAALALEYSLTPEDLSNILTTSGIDRPLILAKDSKNGPQINKVALTEVVNTIKAENVLLFIVDPFVRCHRCNENDNSAIDKVALTLSRIASQTGCAIGAVHHSKKGSANSPGNMDTARGASSLVSAARIAHTLVGMQKAEADALKITENRSKWFVRLDDAKANLSPPGDGTRWFERISVALSNGDAVGVMRPALITAEQLLSDEDQEVIAEVFRHWLKPITCYGMAQELKKHTESQKSKSLNTIREKIERLFKCVEREKNGRVLTAELGTGTRTKAFIIRCIDETPETPVNAEELSALGEF